jgi:glycerophosphoryl diester phosphodiesterase
MLDHFVERYSAQLIQRKDRVQSLDYHVVAQLRKRVPNLFVSFIMPYSLVFPNTDANAYTAEVTTLNDGFVDRAQARGQQVWAWTVNDEDVMETVMFMGVDGVVTDNLATLKQTLEEQQNHPSYAQRLRMFATILDATNPSDIIEN